MHDTVEGDTVAMGRSAARWRDRHTVQAPLLSPAQQLVKDDFLQNCMFHNNGQNDAVEGANETEETEEVK